MIRLTFVLRRKDDMNREEFQKYWRENHGPLVTKHAVTLDILRYVQVHTLDDPLNDALPGERGEMLNPYDGVAELWWDRSELMAVPNTPEGLKAFQIALEDEKHFIDFAQSSMWVAKERVFIDRR